MITVELFGVPRIRAGVGRVTIEGSTFGDALRALADSCPALAEGVIRGDRLDPAYRASLDGGRFLNDPTEPLDDGAVLILLSADVGG